jgi:hypothetical protein
MLKTDVPLDGADAKEGGKALEDETLRGDPAGAGCSPLTARDAGAPTIPGVTQPPSACPKARWPEEGSVCVSVFLCECECECE